MDVEVVVIMASVMIVTEHVFVCEVKTELCHDRNNNCSHKNRFLKLLNVLSQKRILLLLIIPHACWFINIDP